jgi:hypothetical protein
MLPPRALSAAAKGILNSGHGPGNRLEMNFGFRRIDLGSTAHECHPPRKEPVSKLVSSAETDSDHYLGESPLIRCGVAAELEIPSLRNARSDHVWSLEEMCALLVEAVSSAQQIKKKMVFQALKDE